MGIIKTKNTYKTHQVTKKMFKQTSLLLIVLLLSVKLSNAKLRILQEDLDMKSGPSTVHEQEPPKVKEPKNNEESKTAPIENTQQVELPENEVQMPEDFPISEENKKPETKEANDKRKGIEIHNPFLNMPRVVDLEGESLDQDEKRVILPCGNTCDTLETSMNTFKKEYGELMEKTFIWHYMYAKLKGIEKGNFKQSKVADLLENSQKKFTESITQADEYKRQMVHTLDTFRQYKTAAEMKVLRKSKNDSIEASKQNARKQTVEYITEDMLKMKNAIQALQKEIQSQKKDENQDGDELSGNLAKMNAIIKTWEAADKFLYRRTDANKIEKPYLTSEEYNSILDKVHYAL